MPSMLEHWLALSPEEGAARLAAERDAEAALRAMGDECERLCAANVGAGLRAGERLRAACDDLTTRGVDGALRARPRVLRALTTALGYAGRLEEALRVADEAIADAERIGLPIDGARAAVASLHPLTKLGRVEEALVRGERARRTLLEFGEPALAARADINLGNLRKSIGQLAEAVEHLARARIALASDAAMQAHVENTLGEIELQRDDFAAARLAFEASARHFAGVGQGFAAAIVEANLADLAAREGRLQESLAHFERARGVLERDDARGHLARIAAEEAEVLHALGAPNEALAVLEHSLAWLEARGFAAESLRARLARARTCASLGRLSEARADAEQARSGAAERADRHLERRAALLAAEIDLRDGALGRAATAAKAIAEDPTTPALDRCIAEHHLAKATALAGDPEVARALLDAAIARCRAIAVSGVLADLLIERAAISDAAQAAADLDEAVAAIERLRASIRAERLRAAWTGSRSRAYERLALLRIAEGTPAAFDAAFDAVERSKSRTLLDLVQRVVDRSEERDDESDPARAALRAEFDRLRRRLAVLYSRWERDGAPGERRSVVPLDDVAEEIRADETALEGVMRRLAAREGERSLLAQPLPAASIRGRLAPDERLVAYSVADGELLALVASREGIAVRRRLAPADAVDDAVRKLLFRMRRAARARREAEPERLAEDLRALERLHATLWAPIEDALGDARRVVIVPHGALHGLPFAALRSAASGRFVVEEREIRTAPSAMLGTANGAPKRASEEILVVGVADLAAPAIAEEARQVAAIWPCAKALVGAVATADAVLEEAPRASIVHLACHGRFSESMPNASGLRLGDRWLSVRELLDARLQARLVLLAGCETGRAALEPGDEAVGLPRAVLAAGAAAVLVSLWPVDDAAAAELMVDLHRRLAASPERRPSALVRESMLAAKERRPHPSMWAVFSLVGADPQATLSDARGADG